jgi:hypothetical protein
MKLKLQGIHDCLLNCEENNNLENKNVQEMGTYTDEIATVNFKNPRYG